MRKSVLLVLAVVAGAVVACTDTAGSGQPLADAANAEGTSDMDVLERKADIVRDSVEASLDATENAASPTPD